MLGASKNSVSWVTMTIILTNIGLGILVAWAFLRFGSLTAAAAYVAGDRLLVDKTNKSFGRVIQGDTPSVEFALYNTTSKPVAIIGVSSSCTCVVVEDLPLTIPPSSNVSLRAKREFGNLSGVDKFTEIITITAGDSLSATRAEPSDGKSCGTEAVPYRLI